MTSPNRAFLKSLTLVFLIPEDVQVLERELVIRFVSSWVGRGSLRCLFYFDGFSFSKGFVQFERKSSVVY